MSDRFGYVFFTACVAIVIAMTVLLTFYGQLRV